MICAGAGERSAVCWECFINLPPPSYLNYFCQRAPGGGAEGEIARQRCCCAAADIALWPVELLIRS